MERGLRSFMNGKSSSIMCSSTIFNSYCSPSSHGIYHMIFFTASMHKTIALGILQMGEIPHNLSKRGITSNIQAFTKKVTLHLLKPQQVQYSRDQHTMERAHVPTIYTTNTHYLSRATGFHETHPSSQALKCTTLQCQFL